MSDIKFNYPQWIKNSGRRSTWSKEPLVGLGREYGVVVLRQNDSAVAAEPQPK
jgi:hypothetical protein